MNSRSRMMLLLTVFGMLWTASIAAHQPPAQPPVPTQTQVDELRAMVVSLQVRLLAAEKELGQEKERRAALEQERLRDSLKTLDPAVQRLLGMTPPEPPKPASDTAPKKN